MTDFTEVADRVWVARYAWADANVTAIGGERGLVVVDTLGSVPAARGILDDLRRLDAGGVSAVVNTHWHWDHSFGNAAFREVDAQVPIHAHEECASWLAEHGESTRARLAESDAEHGHEMAETELVLPDHLLSGVAVIDLGDRVVELVHCGRGHTEGDVVVRVPDADVLLAGDLVEESAHPWIGADSWPLEWPRTLNVALGMIADTTVVVPGHGVPVDRDFVEGQIGELALIAQQVATLAGSGVPQTEAAAAGSWPWPADDPGIANAVARGYEQLPPSAKRLPLA